MIGMVIRISRKPRKSMAVSGTCRNSTERTMEATGSSEDFSKF